MMINRRSFLGTTFGSLAAAATGSYLIGSSYGISSSTLGRPDTLFLTWQRDPTTTMTVQWIAPPIADEANGVVIEFSEDSEGAPSRHIKTQTRPYPLTDLKIHRAELTGLNPGTEYRFRIGQSALPHRFRTMPAKLTNTFQFVSGGDCDINSHAVANNILAAKQDPMFALIGGDLGYDNGTRVDKSLGFIQNYSRHMIDSRGRLIPLVVCIGNHEVQGGFNKPRENAPFFFALHDGLYADRSFGTLDFGDYLSLVLLDSGHVAPIEGEQTAWLDRVLKERAERPHVFAVNHVPAYPSFRLHQTGSGEPGTGEENRKHWVPLFERHNVDIVLEHHDHTFKRTHPLREGLVHRHGVLYLGDGSWGKLRAPQAPEKRPYLVTASESYHFSLHRLEGEERFHLALAETGRVVDVCSSRKRPLRASGRGGSIE
jgi:hypothetical protein